MLHLFRGDVDQQVVVRQGLALVLCHQPVYALAELRVLVDQDRLLLALEQLQSSATVMAKSWQRSEGTAGD